MSLERRMRRLNDVRDKLIVMRMHDDAEILRGVQKSVASILARERERNQLLADLEAENDALTQENIAMAKELGR